MAIATYNQFLDTILELVSATEPDREIAISAAATIGSLYERGYDNLAEQVLLTYKPERTN
jgi:hypothetical protein